MNFSSSFLKGEVKIISSHKILKSYKIDVNILHMIWYFCDAIVLIVCKKRKLWNWSYFLKVHRIIIYYLTVKFQLHRNKYKQLNKCKIREVLPLTWQSYRIKFTNNRYILQKASAPKSQTLICPIELHRNKRKVIRDKVKTFYTC